MGKRGLLLSLGLLAVGTGAWWMAGGGRSHGSLPGVPARASAEPAEPAALLAEPAAPEAEAAGGERTAEEQRLPRVAVADAVEESTPPGATVVVHVRRSDTGGPAPGELVLLLREGEERPDTVIAAGSSGDLGDAAHADAGGRCTFRIPAGVHTRAMSSRTFENEAEEVTLVGPLLAGEVREVTLVIQVFQHWIRVEDASDGAALVGARVRSGGQRVAMGADGLAMLWCAKGDEDQAQVEAEGYGPASIAVRPGHEAPESALVVRLSRAACLSGRVLDAEDRPIEAAEITVTARGSDLSWHEAFSLIEGGGGRFVLSPDRGWAARTDGSGAFTLCGLPPLIFLQVTVSGGGLWLEVPERMQLAPGEEKQVVYRLGAEVTVRGLVRDESGQAIPGCLLWLRAGAGLSPFAADGPSPERGFHSDEQGRFEIADVPPGEWAVGPAPGWGYEPVPVPVHVPAGLSSVEIVVEVRRASSEAFEVQGQEGTPVTAEGGGRLAGRLVDDATGRPVSGGVTLTGGGLTWRFSTVGASGEFAFEDLMPGPYDITARTPAGAVGWLERVEIGRPGAVKEDLVIRLIPGGQLALRFPLGEEGRHFRVLSGTCVHVSASVGPEEVVTPHLPPGEVTVELLAPGDKVLLSKKAVVRAGEIPTVDLSKEP